MKNTLNIGIVAHIDAGKTTLTEHILFESGVTRAKGRVDHASTITDDLAVERKRGITIKEKTVSFNWNGIKINLLDTPGHADFLGEVVRAFHVLDIAILVISAKESVQPQTVAIYNLLANMGLPIVIFINKLDRVGADVEQVRTDIADLGTTHIMMRTQDEAQQISHWSNNEEYVEDNLLTLAEFDNDIITQFENGNTIDDIIYKLTALGKVIPVFMGVALQGIGVRDLLNELCRIHQHRPISTVDAPPSAIIYKISFNERRERKIYFRMYAGTIRVREKYKLAQNSDNEIRIKVLETITGAKLETTDHVSAGEIGVLTNIDGLKVGDIIGEHSDSIRTVAEVKPIFSVNVRPIKTADRQRLLDALSEMTLEDGQLDFGINGNEIEIKLLGELQKEFIKAQLLDKYHIDTEFSETKTIFKETPIATGEADFGLVSFKIEPLPKGSGAYYEFDRNVGLSGGLTKSRLDAVEEAALNSLIPGVLMVVENGVVVPFRPGTHGLEVTDIRIIFTNCVKPIGPMPPPGEFSYITPHAVKQAICNAGTQILEPIYYYEIVAHTELCGKISSEITNHSGSISSIEDSGAYVKIYGKLPARVSQSFMLIFQSITKNMGNFDVQKIEYEPYTT